MDGSAARAIGPEQIPSSTLLHRELPLAAQFFKVLSDNTSTKDEIVRITITSWCILAIGLFFDLYSLVLVSVTVWKGKASSSAPVVGAILYLPFALVRKAVRLDAHWALAARESPFRADSSKQSDQRRINVRYILPRLRTSTLLRSVMGTQRYGQSSELFTGSFPSLGGSYYDAKAAGPTVKDILGRRWFGFGL